MQWRKRSSNKAGLFDEEKGTTEVAGEVKSNSEEMTESEKELFAETVIESDKEEFIQEKKAEQEDLLNFEIPTL